MLPQDFFVVEIRPSEIASQLLDGPKMQLESLFQFYL